MTVGRFILWVIFGGVLVFCWDLDFGGDLVFGGFGCFFFFFFLFVLLLEMTGGTGRSVGGVCVVFILIESCVLVVESQSEDYWKW